MSEPPERASGSTPGAPAFRPPSARLPPAASRALLVGAPRNARGDFYFQLVEASWARVLAAFALTYVGVNALFALLFGLCPGAIAGGTGGSFREAFFFSVQTLSTIGYGTLAPGNLCGDLLVSVEATVGTFLLAVVTGLVFARVSRPRSAALFSEPMVLTRLHGKPALMLRVGNARGNDVVEATVTLSALVDEISPEGHHLRRVRDLKLVRTRQPMFVLSWTVIHELDEESPLAAVDWQRPQQALFAIVATLTGHDATYGQTTHARHTYAPGDVRVGHRFVDVLHTMDDGRLKVDYTRFHETTAEGVAEGRAASG